MKRHELDALRGIAALVVFAGHFAEGLAPGLKRVLAGTPLFGILNGPAAVIVFFVLSGFVLTARALRTRSYGPLVALGLRRWPRLAVPVAAAALAWSAAALLGAFPRPGEVAIPPDGPPYLFWGFTLGGERVGAALSEALAGTFLSESAQYNPVLWTMHWEFLGSFLSLALAAVLIAPWSLAVRAALFALGWLAAGWFSPWLIAFPVGVAGAYAHDRIAGRVVIPKWAACIMAAAGLVLLSWDVRAAGGAWTFTDALGPARLSAWMIVEATAAAMLMAVVMLSPPTRRWLSGRLGRFAGRLSFAFYLLHLMVLLTLGSWLFLWLGPAAAPATFVACLAAAVAVSIPLAALDRWWLRVLHARRATVATTVDG